MKDMLIGLLKEHAGEDIMKKFNLDDDKADQVVKKASEATDEVAKQQMASGGLGGLMNLFSNKDNSEQANGIQNNLKEVLAQKLEDLGLGGEEKSNIIAEMVPKIIGAITSKNEETDEEDASPLMGLFGGASDAGDAIKGAFGKFF